MNEYIKIIAPLATGLLLGSIFFGGLWLTVSKAMSSGTPALWFIVSFLIRTAIVLTGFYFISNGNFIRLVVCLLGFIVARMLVKRLLPNSNTHPLQIKKGATREA